MKVVCVHLLNDRSGSPRVLSNSILSMKKKGFDVSLFIGSSGYGILSDIDVNIKKFCYKRFNNKFLTLFSYLFSQFSLFILLVLRQESRSADIIYVNTLMPFSAALFGWVFGKKVVYHIHENSVSPRLLSAFLVSVVNLTASKTIFVSNAHKDSMSVKCKKSSVIYNSYDPMFETVSNSQYEVFKAEGEFRVLMLASLRVYKGIDVFESLAQRFLKYDKVKFDLVLNDTDEEVQQYKDAHESSNLFIHFPVSNPCKFYENATLLMNLSLPNLVVETFGLTIVEAMSFGIPVIVPPVGGPSEIVDDGVHGYLIDSRDISQLESKLSFLVNQPQLMMQLSAAARNRSKKFSSDVYNIAILRALEEL